jgi:hypothetical protein
MMGPMNRLGIACALVLAGCASVGPPTVVRDRFDYVAAISDSWKRQTLLNLLKVRYADAPVFMDVTSVIAAYSAQLDINGGVQVTPVGRAGDTFGSAGAAGQFTDKPTITYQPLSGDKFARSLMAPIPVSAILALIQAGYPADQVLRFCVNSVNGMDNAYSGTGSPRPGDPKFRALMSALREAQATGTPGFRTRTGKDGNSVVMFFAASGNAADPAVKKIRELLRLPEGRNEYRVDYGSFPEPDADIAILTRSLLQVMIDLSGQIEVPASDVAEGRVAAAPRSAEQQGLFPALIAVHNGEQAPEDAHVAVKFRGRSFWIDDRDAQSKHNLMFLMMAFSLTEGAPTQAAPVVTIPAR